MNYTVVFLRVFLRRFGRLHPKLKTRISRRIQELAQNPYMGIKLIGELEGFRKDRIGKYRMVYKIDETKKEIVFYDVDIRKRVYR